MGADMIDILLKYGTSPGLILLFLLWQEQRRKRNGERGIRPDQLKEMIGDAVTKALQTQREQTTQHLDLALTTHFGWLRDDLERKISVEHESTRKDYTNALQRLVLDLELFVLRGQERRDRE